MKKNLINADELIKEMEDRDNDCTKQKDATDRGYSMAVKHMKLEISVMDHYMNPGVSIEELREELSRGCEYAGTQEVVHQNFLETMEELGGIGDWDEMAAEDLEGKMCVLQSLFEIFYDKTVEKILNYIESYEENEE